MVIADQIQTRSTRPTGITIGQGKPMYAIAFDMGSESLLANYGNRYDNAFVDIGKVRQSHGFNWLQGSTYFGGEANCAVTCVMAVVDLSKRLTWFAASVRDIRMLWIEELNDLMPAVQQAGNP